MNKHQHHTYNLMAVVLVPLLGRIRREQRTDRLSVATAN